ncbi:MAG: DUF1203 domain-containing protein [Dehalococcoidia bacterium]|nr:DUF1203 domain-containing protein [Dehalococcoidia bacterium]
MTYRIAGLDPNQFASLVGADEVTLADARAQRVTAVVPSKTPCRVTLDYPNVGESLILLHHVSHDVATPYRSSYAIFIRESAGEAAEYVDSIPPVFVRVTLALRGFDSKGMLHDHTLAAPGEADSKIRAMLDLVEIAYIDVHNAAPGCFAARVERT